MQEAFVKLSKKRILKGEIRQNALEEAGKISVDVAEIDPELVWKFYRLNSAPCTRHNVPNPKSA